MDVGCVPCTRPPPLLGRGGGWLEAARARAACVLASPTQPHMRGGLHGGGAHPPPCPHAPLIPHGGEGSVGAWGWGWGTSMCPTPMPPGRFRGGGGPGMLI